GAGSPRKANRINKLSVPSRAPDRYSMRRPTANNPAVKAPTRDQIFEPRQLANSAPPRITKLNAVLYAIGVESELTWTTRQPPVCQPIRTAMPSEAASMPVATAIGPGRTADGVDSSS